MQLTGADFNQQRVSGVHSLYYRLDECEHHKDCETALWAKKGFIERKALLKEILYCREGLNCPNFSRLSVL